MKHSNAPVEDGRTTALGAGLTPPQKAAAILVAMGKPSAGKLLKFFKQEELKALIEAARMLQTISQSELERIVADFEAEFTEGAGLLDSGDQMDTLLNEAFSPEELDELMGRGGGLAPVDTAPTVWTRLEGMEADRVRELIGEEHPQTIALVLSNVKAESAAAVLLTFAKPQRTDIVRRMLALSNVQPSAQKLLESQLQSRLAGQSRSKNQSAGQARVASILNEFDKNDLDELMDDLERSGKADVEALRSRLFSFEDIVRLDQKSRVAVFDGLSTEIVTLALREADQSLQEATLSAIGGRSRRMIEAELAGGGDVSIEEIMKARKTIAATVLRLAQAGQVELPSYDDQAA